MRIGARWFENVRTFRGEIQCANKMRFTLAKFETHDEAELYALELMLRYRGIFAPSGAIAPPPPNGRAQFGGGNDWDDLEG